MNLTNNDKQIRNQIDDCYQDFIKVIKDRLGIVIHDHQVKELYKVIASACEKFNCTPNHYLDELRHCADQSPLLEYLVTNITVGETYFFRDKNQMLLLKEKILPEIIKEKRNTNNLSIRIWSAGCATGEEIYTIAIILDELLPDINKWNVQLLGTDINVTAIAKAIAGVFGEWSMRSIDSYYKNHYFIKENNKYVLQNKIKEHVNFAYLNLNDDSYPSIFNGTSAQDLILCRNVFIYFDSNHVAKLMCKLSSSLVPGGYLLLGASDPISLVGTDLQFDYHKGTLFTRPKETLPIMNAQIPAPVVKAEKLILPRKVVTKQEPSRQALTSKTQTSDEELQQLLLAADWPKALEVIHKKELLGDKSLHTLNTKATLLANMGKLDLAEKTCREAISLNKTEKNLYFTFALILIELNKLAEAEDALKKVLFLDNKSVPAFFQLGLLQFRQKNISAGVKNLTNALSIAQINNPEDKVEGTQGLSYGRLSEILKQEINIHTNQGGINYVNQSA